ncbi:MAG: glycosyl transferase, partial [Bacilli bacterium]|nr:glycosyl transferase [Bacilli bacterium]
MGIVKKVIRKGKEILSLCLSDKAYINMTFKKKFGHKPDLDHPKTLCEKIEWLKLNDRKPFYTDLVDKVKAKEIAKFRGLNVIPLLGVYDKFDDIDFDKLPNQFVIKTNHTSGGYVVCKDKASFDINNARKIINKSLKKNYYKYGREWPYKNVERKILIEEYIDSLGKE